MGKYSSLLWWEWILLIIYWLIWLQCVAFALLWCAAAIFYAKHCQAAAFLGGIALAVLGWHNPLDMVVPPDKKRLQLLARRRGR